MAWDDLRYVLALARTGSVRGAGASLRVSHSTVARRVEALEANLGVRLFDRHRDGYQLTEAGQRAVSKAERIESEMAGLEREVMGQDDRLEGSVRITCTDSNLAELLIEALIPLCESHPRLELEVDTETRYLDLSRREADIALRAVALGASPPEHLLGRKVAPIVLASYVGVAFATRLDPAVAEGPSRWLGSSQSRVHTTLIRASSYPDLPIWGAFSSMTTAALAAVHGLGLAMLPTYVGDAHPGLQRLRRPDIRHVADFWLLSHPDLRDNARLQAVRQAIGEALEARAALFEGRSTDAPQRPEDAPRAPTGSHLGFEDG